MISAHHTEDILPNRSELTRRSLLLSLLACAGCRARNESALDRPAGIDKTDTPSSGPQLFREVAEQAGLSFVETNGATGKFAFIETTPGGCAFLDYDNDGFLDVLLIQSGPIPGSPSAMPRPPCSLYHNNGDGSFTDVTHQAGLDFNQGYAQGVAVGDYNNDGYPDIFITGYNGCFLLQNDRNGHFIDVTVHAGVGERGQNRWATSAAFGDYDNDGHLDLIVLHYAPWTLSQDIYCKDARGRKDYCSPEVYGEDHPTLYHNNGDGTFSDVTHHAGMDKLYGRGLAVVWIDYDHDGREDLYITNDLKPNMLLHNEGGGRFRNVGLQSGVAYGSDGRTLSGMGIAAGDYTNIGWESMVVTNFSGQPDSVYLAVGNGQYEDATYPSGIGSETLNYLAFGIETIDYNRDGWRDLIIGNGHVDPYVAESAPDVTYAEPKLLFRNDGEGRFSRVTHGVEDLNAPVVTRGLAVGDYDNDGRVDILANNHNGPAQLFHNESLDGNHWIILRLEGVKSNRDGAGTLAWITAGGRRYFAECRLGSSYASSSDKRLFFGLGGAKQAETLEVRWLGGLYQKFTRPFTADRFYWLREGDSLRIDPRVRPARRSS